MMSTLFYADIHHEILILKEMGMRMHTYLPRAYGEDIADLQIVMNRIEKAALQLEDILKNNCNVEP